MLPEPIAVTLQVIDALEQVGARYVIGGSLASTVHGVVRTTLDTDIVADLSLRQAQPFADLLAGTFYLDIDTIRHAIRMRGTFNVIHLATMFKVDIFIPKGRPFDRQQLDRRQPWVADPDSGRCSMWPALKIPSWPSWRGTASAMRYPTGSGATSWGCLPSKATGWTFPTCASGPRPWT